MTRDDVIKLARQAGMQGMLTDVVTTLDELQRFAALVAQQEREACIYACKSVISPQMIAECDWSQEGIAAAEGCVDAIRARADSTVKQSLTVAEAVAAEREACLAEIETGIWIDMTTDEILASIADAIRARGAK